jgi:heat shock protein HslJ
MKNFVLTAIIAALVAGCSNSKKTTNQAVTSIESLYQTEWKLTELRGAAIPVNSKASLGFTAGEPVKVSGNTGCNHITDTVEISKTGTIKFSPLATTRMACIDNGIGELENKFLAVLANSNSWSLNNNELILSNGSAVLAKLEKHETLTTEESRLKNGAWELNYISGAKIAFEGLFPNKKPTIIFELAK